MKRKLIIITIIVAFAVITSIINIYLPDSNISYLLFAPAIAFIMALFGRSNLLRSYKYMLEVMAAAVVFVIAYDLFKSISFNWSKVLWTLGGAIITLLTIFVHNRICSSDSNDLQTEKGDAAKKQ